MRIAISNTARNYGGQEAVAALLARELSARGHDVLFLCRPVFPAPDELPAAARIEPVLGGADWSPLSILRGRRALAVHGSEVLLATTNKDMRSVALSAWSADVPVVVRRAMARPLRSSPHYRFLYGRLPAWIVTNSEATREIMLRSAPWLDPARTSVILNGLDTAAWARAEPADLDLPADALVAGFVGRFVDWKGVLTLADAWPAVETAVPRAWLVLAGEGEMEGEMRARLTGANRVRWLGFRTDVPSLMKAFDLLAFPSVMEGFGLAAVEAMAVGTPVVGARAGSLPEVLGEDGGGVLVEPGSVGGLEAALVRLLSDEELRRRLGAAGSVRARERFGLDRMVDAWEDRLVRVVGAGR